MSSEVDIVLGPILGLEEDDLYTVIFASHTRLDTASLQIRLSPAPQQEQVQEFSALKEVTKLRSTFVYKFAFRVKAPDAACQIHYDIRSGGAAITDKLGNRSWTFVIPGAAQVPKIGFASCNGYHKSLPCAQPDSDYVMWDRLYQSHCKEGLGYAFHCFILGGDQVYADPIWKSVDYFQKQDLLGFFSSIKVAQHKIPGSEKAAFMDSLEAFYEKLYIDSWSKPAAAKVMAAIPTIMMWDDHDIIDGWGSHSDELQDSEIFKEIFKVAKKYFEAFQIRGKNNCSRISDADYSLQLRFRNFEIFALDNRSHRTQKQVMSDDQFLKLEDYCSANLFKDVPKELDEDKVLLFAIPVPIAHLNYTKRAERALRFHSPWNFIGSLNDDSIDHWDHQNHAEQQKRLLKDIFMLADKYSPKYVHVISGDVHSGGAGSIKKQGEEGEYMVNEFISSPMVYKPVGRLEQFFLHTLSEQKSRVDGYEISVDPFGFGRKKLKTVYEKNFACFYKHKTWGIRAYFTFEHKEDDYPHQPSIYFRAEDDIA